MTFVNEYVSEEDIQKYQLDEITGQYIYALYEGKHQWGTANRKEIEEKLKLEHYYDWTHDKDLNSWLMKKRSIPVYQESSGIWAGSNTYEFLFYWNNAVYRVILCVTGESTASIYDNPYNTFWEFQSMTTLEGKPVKPIETLLKDLAEAIKVYGRNGIRQQTNNGQVEFVVVKQSRTLC